MINPLNESTLWSNRVDVLSEQWRRDGFSNYRKDVRDKIVQLLPPNEVMLDVGCGSSMLYKHLPQDISQRYTGVDFTPEFIELCKKKYPEGRWLVEDARTLTFPDNSFHLVNSTTVLQHIPEWRKAARELVRVAKKYVVSTCRSHLSETEVISTNPVLRRRFNPEDIVNLYSQYGDVSWRWVDGVVSEKHTMGLYVLEKDNE